MKVYEEGVIVNYAVFSNEMNELFYSVYFIK